MAEPAHRARREPAQHHSAPPSLGQDPVELVLAPDREHVAQRAAADVEDVLGQQVLAQVEIAAVQAEELERLGAARQRVEGGVEADDLLLRVAARGRQEADARLRLVGEAEDVALECGVGGLAEKPAAAHGEDRGGRHARSIVACLRSQRRKHGRAQVAHRKLRLGDVAGRRGLDAEGAGALGRYGEHPAPSEISAYGAGRFDRRSYLPFQTGSRFSAKAIAPSRASSLVNTGPAMAPCFSHASASVQSSALATIFFDASSASGPLRAISAARSSATCTALPGSASRLTTPSWCARSARIGSPVSAISIATWYGMRLGRRMSAPPAATSERLASGIPMRASRAATMRSQASAISNPPATAKPSMAAMSGLSAALCKPAVAHPWPLAGGERLEVHAGAEALAGAGQDADGDVVGFVEVVERRGDAFGQRQIHGVARVGAVEGDEQDAVPALGEDGLGVFVGHGAGG